MAGNHRRSSSSPREETGVPWSISKRPRLSNNRTDVSLRMAKQLLMNDDSNIVFSPLSINVLLSLVAAGSGGPTLDQFLDLFDSETLDDINSMASKLISVVFPREGASGDKGPKLSFASGAWLKQSLFLKDSFQQVVHDVHKTAALNRVDFNKYEEVVKEVNFWADKETNGLIKEILPPGSVDRNTILVLANALYFKGSWIEKFNPSKTRNQEFHLIDGSSVRVPFMTSERDQFVSEFEDFKVLKLPYAHGKEDDHRFSMYIFLPNEIDDDEIDDNEIDGLPSLSDRLFAESEFLENHLPTWKTEVGDFRIPKFKISFGFEAKTILQEIGLTLPFDKEKGGLTEMVDLPDDEPTPVVSEIFHKSFVEINEEGTKAAAASASCMIQHEALVDDGIDFVADHPFIFVIRDDMTGVVLFIGRLLDPSMSH